MASMVISKMVLFKPSFSRVLNIVSYMNRTSSLSVYVLIPVIRTIASSDNASCHWVHTRRSCIKYLMALAGSPSLMNDITVSHVSLGSPLIGLSAEDDFWLPSIPMIGFLLKKRSTVSRENRNFDRLKIIKRPYL